MSKSAKKGRSSPRRRSGRRYIFHDSIGPYAKVYLVYHYNNEDVILMTDGPFYDEHSAYCKMRDLLLKGCCAWMVTYND